MIDCNRNRSNRNSSTWCLRVLSKTCFPECLARRNLANAIYGTTLKGIINSKPALELFFSTPVFTVLLVVITMFSTKQMWCHDLFTFPGWIPCQQWVLYWQSNIMFSCSFFPPNSQLQENLNNQPKQFTKLLKIIRLTVLSIIFQSRWLNQLAFGKVCCLAASSFKLCHF